ncbi:MAG: hypothetical protein KGH66_00640 [Candidatus Micrarchaeota archaeon]|nr:hypothetical protein [Candidatus Micrarchaeota archaeon]
MAKSKSRKAARKVPKAKVKVANRPKARKAIKIVKKIVKKAQAKAVARPAARAKEAKDAPIKSGAEAITQKLKKYEAGEDISMSRRARSNVSIPDPEAVKTAVEGLMANELALEYLKKNVSKRSTEVLGMLITPKTDEFLAEKMDMKINAVRRMLNIMQGYGITNYYISKNTNGWLSFSWYINTSKLGPFLDYINNMERDGAVVNENCNDYFVCSDCYKTDKLIFTFDAAFENSFKCNCGNSLDRMDSSEVEGMLSKKADAVENRTV